MNLFPLFMIMIAHSLIGLYFIYFGIWNIYAWAPTIEVMVEKNIPYPFFILSIGIAWQVIAGGMIFFGFLIPVAAIALIPFTIISAFMFHPYWKYRGKLHIESLAVFVANMTITLGVLILLASM